MTAGDNFQARNLMFTDVRRGLHGEVQMRYPSRACMAGKTGRKRSLGDYLDVRSPRWSARRATGAACYAPFGSGLRGGNWNNNSSNARVSDRNNAANANNNRNNNNGGRCARTSLRFTRPVEG